ncbi:MAG: hypothetical protein RL026_707 [Pseudomonadota bacterium]|jgi:hypothetical protein
MPVSLAVLSLVLQAALIVHCIKTGRNQIWIWVLALLSFAGVIAYVAAELIPGLLRSRTTARTVKGVKQALDPEATLRKLEADMRATGGVATRQRYAEELLRRGRAGEAVGIYREALTGLYEHDPELMLGLARAQFEAGEPAAARGTLDALIQATPQFKSPAGHLLYARALEAEGNAGQALSEYAVLAGYYPGAEATVRYAQLLVAQSRRDEARGVLQELTDRARVAPEHYRRTQQDWLKRAAQVLAGL